jgi:CAAX protease family protein
VGLAPRDHGLKAKTVAVLEFLLGAAIVIGHNVFRVVPNEVPILVGLGLVSNRFRTGSWRVATLGRPSSWPRVLGVAMAAAAVRIVLGDFVIEPLTRRFWPPIAAAAGADSITGNLGHALVALLVVWTFAAFGEEFGYRGYLLSRAADAGGESAVARWAAVVVVAILFGFGHYYKGPAGILDSGVAGLILGAAFLLSGRNLWAAVLAHGLIDTFAVVAVYFG